MHAEAQTPSSCRIRQDVSAWKVQSEWPFFDIPIPNADAQRPCGVIRCNRLSSTSRGRRPLAEGIGCLQPRGACSQNWSGVFATETTVAFWRALQLDAKSNSLPMMQLESFSRLSYHATNPYTISRCAMYPEIFFAPSRKPRTAFKIALLLRHKQRCGHGSRHTQPHRRAVPCSEDAVAWPQSHGVASAITRVCMVWMARESSHGRPQRHSVRSRPYVPHSKNGCRASCDGK